MISLFWKRTLLFSLMMMLPLESVASIDVEKRYAQTLQKEYIALSPLQERAKIKKRNLIISTILALVVFLLFTYYFKLTGVIIALIMIAAGFYVLKTPDDGTLDYKHAFKERVLSSLIDYTYHDSPFTEDEIKNTSLFAARFKSFSAWDLYEKGDTSFSYVHIVFDTKENASVERMNRNIFEGFILKIKHPSHSDAVAVSELLRDTVSGMDFTMSSFFADKKGREKRGGFDIYGALEEGDFNKIAALQAEAIAISFNPEATYVAFFHRGNPLSVNPSKDFDLQQAKSYAKSVAQLESLIAPLY